MITVNKWRNRRLNRRCIYCVHAEHLPSIISGNTDSHIWCRAKSALRSWECKRPFCSLYQQKENENEP